MMNSTSGTQDLEAFLSDRFLKIEEAREEINQRKQLLKMECSSPSEADEKENTDVINQAPFQVLNVKKKSTGKNDKQISTPLQSNRQRTPMPILPAVGDNPKNGDSVTTAALETPKTVRRRRPPKELVFADSRELEKQRLASAMASSTGTAVLGYNSTQVSPRFTEMRKFISNMPAVSPRQLEIDRLASLFESSEESCLRNSKIVVDEYPKTPVNEYPKTLASYDATTELPNSCNIVCPALNVSLVDDHLSKRGEYVIKIDKPDKDLSNDSDAAGDIPSIVNLSETPKHSTSHKFLVQTVNCFQESLKRLEQRNFFHPVYIIIGQPTGIEEPLKLKTEKFIFEKHEISLGSWDTCKGNGCVSCIENENCLRKSTLTVPGNVLMGVGEHEAKRSQLLKERRREYCDYMKQARLKVRNPRGEPQLAYCSHNMVRLKDIATQTDDEPPSPYLLEPDDYRGMGNGLSLPTSPEYSDRSRSPMKSPRGRGNLDLHKSAYCFPGISPSTPVFDKPATGEVGKPTSEMYIRQYQYREELKKQIEERQRLEAERKERERLEEEAIEKRVREQQEKLRRQYEIEEQERLDYIMRRHIQDDVLRQRLADIQQQDSKPLREKTAKQQRMRPMTVTHDVCRTKAVESINGISAAVAENNDGGAGPEPGDPASVSELIESAEAILKAPLLEENAGQNRVAHTACSAPSPPPLPPSPLQSHSVVGCVSPCRRQVETLLREPLLPDDSLPVLKAVSPCVNVPRTKPRTNNAEILDNKWKVPAVEKSYIQPTVPLDVNKNPVNSSPDNVLTQLSSFRRQLQMEHFRLIDRMQQQSKRRSS